jgi:PAS domain S-box-containing protein
MLAWISLCHAALAGVLVIDDASSEYRAGPIARYMQDTSGQLSASDVFKNADQSFHTVGSDAFYAKVQTATFWFTFTVRNDSPETSWFLDVAAPLVGIVELYELDEDGSQLSFRGKAGDRVPAAQWDVKYHRPFFQLKIPTAEQRTYFIKVETIASAKLPLRLIPMQLFSSEAQIDKLIYGGFFGMLVGLILYNAALFAITRDVSFFWYVLYSTFFGLVLFASHGYSKQYFWPHFGDTLLRELAIFGSLAVAATVQFARRFLDTPRTTPAGDKCLIAFSSFATAVAFAGYFSSTPKAAYLAMLYAALAVGPFLLFSGVQSLRGGYLPARYYLFSFVFPVLGVGGFTLRSLGVLEANALTVCGIYFGGVLEVIFLSIALADRITQLKNDKAKAMALAYASAKLAADTLAKSEQELEKKVEARGRELEVAQSELSQRYSLNEAVLKALSEMGEGLSIIENGRITFANEAVSKITGYSYPELLAIENFSLLFDPNSRQAIQQEYRARVLQQKHINYKVELHLKKKDGTIIDVSFTIESVQLPDRPLMLVVVLRDITEQTLSETLLKRSEERFRLAVENLPSTFALYDADMRIQFLNARGYAAFNFTGYTEEDVLGKRDDELLPDHITRNFLPALREAVKTRRSKKVECEVPLPHETQTVIVNYIPLLTSTGEIYQVLGITHDITAERRHAKLKLESEEAKFKLILDNLPASVYVKDRSGTYLMVNRSFATMVGLKPFEIVGKTDCDLADSGCVSKEMAEDCGASDLAVWSSGMPVQVEEEVRMDRRRTFITSKFLLENQDDLTLCGISTEITERKLLAIQLREHQTQLAHVDRINTMGEMASGIAHELNQPLSAILSFNQASIRLLDEYEPDLQHVREILTSATHQTQRAGEIIRRLRAFVSKRAPQMTEVDIDSMVSNAIEMDRHEIEERGAVVEQALCTDLPLVFGDAIQIEQVVVNLIRNALDAMEATPDGEKKLVVRTMRVSDSMVQVTVSDTGSGISEDVRTRIFLPFFTTKTYGMGLGLAISTSIVEAHGGKLIATANPAGGTTFAFTVPVAVASR